MTKEVDELYLEKGSSIYFQKIYDLFQWEKINIRN